MTDDDDKRPNPDQLLSEIKRQEAKEGVGRLKVFLGMVAGVGKTFAMLQDAHQLKTQGVDVVVGWVETHGRKATEALLQGLDVLPRRSVQHRAVVLGEMDVEAILARRPAVVLVDELAHTNTPGSRHTKRYLDVLDILEAGIDVHTTLNVQHLESRVGTVREITGVTVHETVPDSVLDQAGEIVLIDIAPDELLRRLREGAIYPAERIETASINFFKKVNLTALREIALRLAAERVDRELRSFKVLHGIDGAWKSGSRLMVAIYASPYSETLIRWTRRLADSMDATWLGVYVEDEAPLSGEERSLLAKNMTLASQLGAEISTTRDNDPVAGILRSARQNNVTQIVVGKSRRGFWSDVLRGGSVVGRLLRQSGDIDVYVVAADGRAAEKHGAIWQRYRTAIPWDESGWLVAVATGAWLVAAFLEPFIGYLAVGILFLLAVSLAGLVLSRVSVLLLAFVFALLHNYFFIPPKGTFEVSKPEDFLTLLMYFVAASTIGHLTSRLRRKEVVLQGREARAVALYKLSKEVAGAKSLDEVAVVGLRNLEQACGAETALILAEPGVSSELRFAPSGSFVMPEKELGVAQWVVDHGRPAGRFTDTLPASTGIYFPLVGREKRLGVIGIKVDGRASLSADEVALVETFARQIAAGVEREHHHDRGRRLQVMEETQKLYRTLLDSVSHELKTPLTAIKGSASALLDPQTASNNAAIINLAGEVLTGTERLQRVVENLLDMTRIESGMLRAKHDLCDAEDIIGTVLRRVEPFKSSHEVEVRILPGTDPIDCDQVLLVQALANIVHNAFAYTPPGTRVEILARQVGPREVEFAVRDQGPGLPQSDPQAVFEKFYRHAPEMTGGVGLGLSIARGFVELQGGRVSAANHPEGGAIFRVVMPSGGASEH